MKLKNTIMIGLSLLAGWQVKAAEEPAELEKATVTVPYSELKRLLQMGAARDALSALDKTKPPPVPGGLMAALLRLDCKGGKAVLEAEFRVENFSGEWESFPLMGAGLAVASIEPLDARVLSKDDQLCLVTNQLGTATVKLRFVPQDIVPFAETPIIEVNALPCAVSTLEIKGLPEGRAAAVSSGNTLLPNSESGIFALPAQGSTITVMMREPAKIAAEMAPPTPSEWTLQNEVAVQREDGLLRYTAHAFLTAQNGSGMEAALMLPASTRQLKVTGEDLEEWKVERSTAGEQSLHVQWKSRGTLEREITVSYGVPQGPLEENWNLTAPSLPKADQTRSLFFVAVPPVTQMQAEKLRVLATRAGLSKWVTETLVGHSVAAIEAPFSTRVQVKPLPQVATAEGTVKLAHFDTRIVGDGSTITEAKFEIEHEGSPSFVIELPADSALLKCALNGQSTKPISDEGKKLEFPMPAGDGKAAKTEVSLSFTSAKGKLDPVSGKVGIELPLTPWFIHAIEWGLILPEGYRISAVDGNIEYGPASKAEHEVLLRKSLCRGEAPKADLFYEKRGL